MIDVFYPLEYLLASGVKRVAGRVAFNHLAGDYNHIALITEDGEVTNLANGELIGTHTLEQVVSSLPEGTTIETAWTLAAWQRVAHNKLFSSRDVEIGNASNGDDPVLLRVAGNTTAIDAAILVTGFTGKGIHINVPKADTHSKNATPLAIDFGSETSTHHNYEPLVALKSEIINTGGMSRDSLIKIEDIITSTITGLGALLDVTTDGNNGRLRVNLRGKESVLWTNTSETITPSNDYMKLDNMGSNIFKILGNGAIITGNNANFLFESGEKTSPPAVNSRITVKINGVTYIIPANTEA